MPRRRRTSEPPMKKSELRKTLEKPSLRRMLRGAALMVTTSFKAAPLLATGVVTFTAVSALANPVEALMIKRIADGVVRADKGAVVTAAVVAAVVSGAAYVMNMYGIAIFRMTMEEKTRLYIERHVLRLVGGLPGLEHHERPEYADEIELLRGGQGLLAQPAGPIVFLFSYALMMVSTLTLLARLHPVLLLLPIAGVPSLIGGGIGTRIGREVSERTVERQRHLAVMFSLATGPSSGKELRIFGIGPELMARQARGQRAVLRDTTIGGAKGAAISAGGSVVFAAGYIGAVIFMARRALHGQATVGDVLLTVTLASTINGMVGGAVTMIGWFGSTMKLVSRYLWLIDYAKSQEHSGDREGTVPARLTEGITFHGVGFRYPASEVDVLSDVNLTLPAGSTVAIVGDNGAGKTTLVKLLCRFYEPTAGTITVDGIVLGDLDPAAWRLRTAAAFQDFATFHFTAQESVGVGDLGRITDADAVMTALQRAQATDVLDSLPSGLGTQLGRQFDDGMELSVGQWQKLALSRALMRDEPLLLLLDEPTASLDAQTEHALFERYSQGARRAASDTGAITVLVSHRFSTVRMADTIIVVDGGRVAEMGSHEQLMAAGGTYAELYEIQARAYR
jgi:ATP-binding cassette subfamily B protein